MKSKKDQEVLYTSFVSNSITKGKSKRTRLIVPLILLFVLIFTIALIGVKLNNKGIEEIANNSQETINAATDTAS